MVSSNDNVKLPDSPQCVGSGGGGSSLFACVATARAIGLTTTVVKLPGVENISNEGRSDKGVCRIDLVVSGIVCRSDGSGPVTVGYVPVQYVRVVTISGVGNTKTTDVSPYETTRVMRARTCKAEVPLESDGGLAVTTTGGFLKVTVDVNTVESIDDDVMLEPFDRRGVVGAKTAVGALDIALDRELLVGNT